MEMPCGYNIQASDKCWKYCAFNQFPRVFPTNQSTNGYFKINYAVIDQSDRYSRAKLEHRVSIVSTHDHLDVINV
jgi:hypothetical protein